MIQIRKQNDVIEIVRGGGCLGVFGIPFFTIGLIFLLSTFTDHNQDFHSDLFDTVLMTLFSIVMMIVGIGMMFGRSRIVIERQATAIHHYFQLLFKKHLSAFSYQDITALILEREDSGEDSPNFVLKVIGGDKNLILLEHSDPMKILHVAQDVATFIGANLENRAGNLAIQSDEAVTPGQYNYGRGSSGALSKIILPVLAISGFLFIFSTLDNWSWDRLQDFRNDIVFVESPEEVFTYAQPGLYDYPLSFYQYKPTFLGNDQKQRLDIIPKNYQLSIDALDSTGGQAVTVVDNKLQIKSSEHHLIRLSIRDGKDSPYKILREDSHKNSQTLLLKPNEDLLQWQALQTQEVPTILRQKAAILDAHFANNETQSYTNLQDAFYLNASIFYHARGSSGSKYLSEFKIMSFEPAKTIAWVGPPMKIVNNFLHAHEGLIYAFGGQSLFASNESINWVYKPKEQQWIRLLATPNSNQGNSKTKASVVALYSVGEKLFVMLHGLDYALYEFDLDVANQWTLIKRFTLPGAKSKWQFYDDQTLFSYRPSLSDSGPGLRSNIGYIQLLDLSSYRLSTHSTTPLLDYNQNSGSLLSPERPSLKIFSLEQKFYAYFSGRFYLQKEP